MSSEDVCPNCRSDLGECDSNTCSDAALFWRSKEAKAAAEPPKPAPMFAGTFAIYQTTEGGLVLVTDVEGRGVEQHRFPAAMVRMLTGTGGGPVGKMARKMFGGK